MSLNDYMRNLNFQIKAKEIGEASWGDSRRKYKPMTMPTVDNLLTSGVQLNKQQNLRNEMVQKYIQEQDQPVRVTVDGEVRDFKFHQVEKPQLYSTEDVERDLQRYEETREDIENRKAQAREYFRRRIGVFEQVIRDREAILDRVEQDKAQLIDDMRIIQESGDRRRLQEWIALRREYVDLDTVQTKTLQDEILDLQFELADVKNELESAIKEIDVDKNQNELVKARVQNELKHNKDEIRSYEQELLALNVGKLNTKQEPMESDEAYFERLQRLADTPYADGGTQEKAQIEQKQQLRDNLISITRSPEVINQVVNGMDFEDPMNIYDLNKIFPIFKERFLKIYGSDNKNVTAQDIINFAEKVVKAPEPDQEQQATDFDGDVTKTDDTLILYDPQGNEFYFKYLEGTMRFNTGERKKRRQDLEEVDKIISKKDMLFYSIMGDDGSFFNINTPTTLKELLRTIGRQSLEKAGLTENSTKRQFIDRMKQLDIDPTDIRPVYIGYQPEGLKQIDHHIVGVGMNSDPKDIPSKVSFGDNVLDLKKLYLKNIFGISDKNGRKIHGIKNTPVSDNFVKVIFNIINGKDLLGKDLSTLSSSEKLFLELVLATSGLHKKHNTGGASQSIEKVKHDYKIIIGEIESGNNGSEIKKKLYEALYSLAHLGAINKGQAQKQYKEIVKSFF